MSDPKPSRDRFPPPANTTKSARGDWKPMALLAGVMQGVGERYKDPAMIEAGKQLEAKAIEAWQSETTGAR
jgi:hypothetical protein